MIDSFAYNSQNQLVYSKDYYSINHYFYSNGRIDSFHRSSYQHQEDALSFTYDSLGRIRAPVYSDTSFGTFTYTYSGNLVTRITNLHPGYPEYYSNYDIDAKNNTVSTDEYSRYNTQTFTLRGHILYTYDSKFNAYKATSPYYPVAPSNNVVLRKYIDAAGTTGDSVVYNFGYDTDGYPIWKKYIAGLDSATNLPYYSYEKYEYICN